MKAAQMQPLPYQVLVNSVTGRQRMQTSRSDSGLKSCDYNCGVKATSNGLMLWSLLLYIKDTTTATLQLAVSRVQSVQTLKLKVNSPRLNSEMLWVQRKATWVRPKYAKQTNTFSIWNFTDVLSNISNSPSPFPSTFLYFFPDNQTTRHRLA